MSNQKSRYLSMVWYLIVSAQLSDIKCVCSEEESPQHKF